jgi:hypothetical protein
MSSINECRVMPHQDPPTSAVVPEGAPFRLEEEGPRLECWYWKRPKGLSRGSWQVVLLLLVTVLLTAEWIHAPTLGGGITVFLFWYAAIVVAVLWKSITFRDEHLILDESGLSVDINRRAKLAFPLGQVHRFEVSEWKSSRKKTTYWVLIRLLEGEIPFAYDAAQSDCEWLAARLNQHLARLLANAGGEALNPWKGL